MSGIAHLIQNSLPVSSNNTPVVKQIELNKNVLNSLHKFNTPSSSLKRFLEEKTGVEKVYYTLKEVSNHSPATKYLS